MFTDKWFQCANATKLTRFYAKIKLAENMSEEQRQDEKKELDAIE